MRTAAEANKLDRRRGYLMHVASELAYQFLRVFARLEFALKGVSAYCQGNEGTKASANWAAFSAHVGPALATELAAHPEWRLVLLDHPPQKEVVRHGVAVFEPRALGGGMPETLLLEAVRRVRNNLFHGGKENPERWPGHDTALITVSLEVLQVAADAEPAVRRRFYNG